MILPQRYRFSLCSDGLRAEVSARANARRFVLSAASLCILSRNPLSFLSLSLFRHRLLPTERLVVSKSGFLEKDEEISTANGGVYWDLW